MLKIVKGKTPNDLNLNNPCIILGCAYNIYDDINKLPFEINENTDIMCVNQIIISFPNKIKHFASFESVYYYERVNIRYQNKNLNNDFILHSPDGWNIKNTDIVWDANKYGLIYSGTLAICIMCSLGYKEIYLCGMPMNGSLKYYKDKHAESQNRKQSMIDSLKNAKEKNLFKGTKVISMSGESKKIFN